MREEGEEGEEEEGKERGESGPTTHITTHTHTSTTHTRNTTPYTRRHSPLPSSSPEVGARLADGGEGRHHASVAVVGVGEPVLRLVGVEVVPV
jgi:hypothetical protein